MLDDEFLLLIERNRKVLASPADGPPALLLAPFAARLQDRLDERHRAIAAAAGLGFNPLKAIAYVAAVPMLGYLGWSLYSNYETARVRDIASGAIAELPALAGYPTQLDVASRGQEVTLTGLVPTAAAKSGLVEKLRVRLPSSSISDRLTVLPNHAAELEPQIARVRRELAGIEGEAVRGAVRSVACASRTAARAGDAAPAPPRPVAERRGGAPDRHGGSGKRRKRDRRIEEAASADRRWAVGCDAARRALRADARPRRAAAAREPRPVDAV